MTKVGDDLVQVSRRRGTDQRPHILGLGSLARYDTVAGGRREEPNASPARLQSPSGTVAPLPPHRGP
jgi:hypothetical protein